MLDARIAVGPADDRHGGNWVEDAIRAGGGRLVDLESRPNGLVWLPAGTPIALHEILEAHPEIEWVQLPSAGVERYAAAGILDPNRIWSCAKGAYAFPVAEHAVALALAGLRRLPERVTAAHWGARGGTSLQGQRVTIVGAGGVARSIVALLAPWDVKATVVSRSGRPLVGADRATTMSDLDDALADALVVFLALALTPQSAGVIGADQLGRMDGHAWLVNVARGGHVDLVALTDALASGEIAGAALDVTDPEPLPDGHPLWREPRCIITPHTADTWEMTRPLLAGRIRANVTHRVNGSELDGVIDLAHGY